MIKPGKVFLEAVKSLFKKNVTIAYPAQKRAIQKSYSGMISFDQPKCIGCNLCVKNCPANAIKINKIADKLFSAVLYLDKCVFCYECRKVCPKKAIGKTGNFELANVDKSKLAIDLAEFYEEKTPQLTLLPDDAQSK